MHLRFFPSFWHLASNLFIGYSEIIEKITNESCYQIIKLTLGKRYSTLVLIFKNEVILKTIIDLGLNVIQYYSTQCSIVSPLGKYVQMLPEGLLSHWLFLQNGPLDGSQMCFHQLSSRPVITRTTASARVVRVVHGLFAIHLI